MKTTKKALLFTFCAVLLVVASVLGTMAYLTSSETVTNTFTVGNVSIKLDEANVKANGEYETDKDNRTEDGNEYHLLPGHTYIKDPTVTVKAGSEESYVRMIVTINEQNDLDEIFAPGLRLNEFFGEKSTDWTFYGDVENTDNNTRSYEFRYIKTVAAPNEDVKLDALFETIKVPGEITNSDLKKLAGLKIDVEAHAIQADGFETENAAWEAFDKQVEDSKTTTENN